MIYSHFCERPQNLSSYLAVYLFFQMRWITTTSVMTHMPYNIIWFQISILTYICIPVGCPVDSILCDLPVACTIATFLPLPTSIGINNNILFNLFYVHLSFLLVGGGGIEPLSSFPLFSYEFRRLVWGHHPKDIELGPLYWTCTNHSLFRENSRICLTSPVD